LGRWWKTGLRRLAESSTGLKDECAADGMMR
jgi:hypothetical protein